MPRRRPSSARWLQEHRDDPYVAAARREGYRSRAAYKLLELQTLAQSSVQQTGHRTRGSEGGLLIRPGMTVVDLGAAPGGWTQVATTLVGDKGRVVAIDLLPMKPIDGCDILQGDFLDATVLKHIHATLDGSECVHVILSDMAPNMSGISCVDQSRGERLAEEAFQFAETTLGLGGDLVLKVFQGQSFHTIVARARKHFNKVKIIKPRASRDRSSEHYLMGLGFRR